MSESKGRTNLPFGIVGRGEVRFAQELSEEEMGNACPLACPACFGALRAARASAYDDGAGVKLAHRAGAGGCRGVEQRHMAAAYVRAAETLAGKFFWTPERHEGDWRPHAADEGGPSVPGHQRLYLIAEALTGGAARNAAHGAPGIDAVLSLAPVEGGRSVRKVGLRIAADGPLDGEGAARAAEKAGMGLVEVSCRPASELDQLFGLSQLQDELTGQGDAKGERRWLFDDACAEPAPEPEPPREPAPEETPEAPAEEPQAPRRGLSALLAKMLGRRRRPAI